MSQYLEVNNQLAFHPGYYIAGFIEEMGLTPQDFAHRLGVTPTDLGALLEGERKLSLDLAVKLSENLGTTAEFWLNLQATYDAMEAKLHSLYWKKSF